jgi:hypothetical protein
VVLGSYLALGNGQVRLDLKLEDASTGEIVDSITASGNDAEVADLVSRAGASLLGKLGAGDVSAADAMTMKASLPSNPEAARLYSEGLTKLRSFDNLTARDLLQKAIAVEPNFSLAHSALATAFAGCKFSGGLLARFRLCADYFLLCRQPRSNSKFRPKSQCWAGRTPRHGFPRNSYGNVSGAIHVDCHQRDIVVRVFTRVAHRPLRQLFE